MEISYEPLSHRMWDGGITRDPLFFSLFFFYWKVSANCTKECGDKEATLIASGRYRERHFLSCLFMKQKISLIMMLLPWIICSKSKQQQQWHHLICPLCHRQGRRVPDGETIVEQLKSPQRSSCVTPACVIKGKLDDQRKRERQMQLRLMPVSSLPAQQRRKQSINPRENSCSGL